MKDESDALKHLDEIDSATGVNNIVNDVVSDDKKEIEPATSIADTSGWKLVKLDTLPSRGEWYPDGIEILIRSVKLKEIRQWSMIDEHDPLDVNEKIYFVLNSCTKFNIKGNPNMRFTVNDILEIDKFHILFKIHRISFPNNENALIAKMKHDKCGHVNSIQVSDVNLKGFEIPDELIEFSSKSHRGFHIVSQKLNDEWNLYMPTIGTMKAYNDYLRRRTNLDEDDKAFNKILPYLIDNWRTCDMNTIAMIKNDYMSWHQNKFIFNTKAIDLLNASQKRKVLSICEKCGEKMESSIFLGGSFTVKDIFIVSTGLRDLI